MFPSISKDSCVHCLVFDQRFYTSEKKVIELVPCLVKHTQIYSNRKLSYIFPNNIYKIAEILASIFRIHQKGEHGDTKDVFMRE